MVQGCLVRNVSKSLANSYTGFYLCAGISFTGVTRLQLWTLMQRPAFVCLLCVAVQGSRHPLTPSKKPQKREMRREGSRISSAQRILEIIIIIFLLCYVCYSLLNISIVHPYTYWLIVHPIFKSHFQNGFSLTFLWVLKTTWGVQNKF